MKKFNLEIFLKRCHCKINTSFISKAFRDTPKDITKYEKWSEETNKRFDNINLNLQHTNSLDDFPQLTKYLKYEISSFDIWEQDNHIYCEIYLN